MHYDKLSYPGMDIIVDELIIEEDCICGLVTARPSSKEERSFYNEFAIFRT